jgi:hypothetical protein
VALRAEAGFPEFTNEVQHQLKVLPWQKDIPSSHWMTGSRLPIFKTRDARSGKSLHVWIARHPPLDALLGSVIELGRIVGVVTPTLDVVYALTSARCRVSAIPPRA